MNTMSLVSQITQHETGHTNSLGNLSASSFSPIHDNHVRALELKKNQGPLPCPECGKLFAKEFDIKRHMYTHTGEKPFKVKSHNLLLSNALELWSVYNYLLNYAFLS